MRVTDSMIAELARRGVADARERAASAQRIASTGIRVAKPSEDPLAAGQARRQRAEETRAAAMLRSADRGAFLLEATDGALDQLGAIVARARELAIQGANGTLSAPDRAAIGLEVAQLHEQAIAIANTQVDGRHVLAGFRDDVPPFDAVTGAFTGDRNVRELDLAPGMRVAVSVPGGDVLAPAGGVDVLATLDSLATSLGANDVSGVVATIGDLSRATEQISEGRARAGAALEAIEIARSLAARARDAAAARRSELVEADVFDALSDLARADAVLQQAVAIAARLPLPGLAQRG